MLGRRSDGTKNPHFAGKSNGLVTQRFYRSAPGRISAGGGGPSPRRRSTRRIPASSASARTGYGTPPSTGAGSGPLASRTGPPTASGAALAGTGRGFACGVGAGDDRVDLRSLGRLRRQRFVARILAAAPCIRERPGDVAVGVRVLQDVGRERPDRGAVARQGIDLVDPPTRVPVADHALRAGLERLGRSGRDDAYRGGKDDGEKDDATGAHTSAVPSGGRR